MTDTNNEQPTASKSPTHIAYHIRRIEGGKDFWNPIGVAWTHRGGTGFNIQLECYPRDGRVTLRLITEKAK